METVIVDKCPKCGRLTGDRYYHDERECPHRDTAAQPFLDFQPTAQRAGDVIEQSALAFHDRNPHVLRELVRVSMQMRERGLRRWSINGAFEAVRYNARLRTDGKIYKLNNNYRAHYARWIMHHVTPLAGFFVIRAEPRVTQVH